MELPTLSPSEAKPRQEYYCKNCHRKPKQGWLKSCKKTVWCTCKCRECVQGEETIQFT